LRLCGEEADGRFEESFQGNLQAGNLRLIFTHPEVAVNNRHCRDIKDISVKSLSDKQFFFQLAAQQTLRCKLQEKIHMQHPILQLQSLRCELQEK